MDHVSSGTTLHLYARWKPHITVKGDISVSNIFEGSLIHEIDRPDTVIVELLNAQTDAVLASQTVTLTDVASQQYRTGSYEFINVADNGTQYRVTVAVPNYELKYRNEEATSSAFSDDMYAAVGFGAITPSKIISRMLEEYRKEHKHLETKQYSTKKIDGSTEKKGNLKIH